MLIYNKLQQLRGYKQKAFNHSKFTTVFSEITHNLILYNGTPMTFFDNFSSFNLIAAHRGFRGCYPENTLCAFKASLGRCHFIELDVQLSKDMIPMVIHDPKLDRTSNARVVSEQLGVRSLRVNKWTREQLKKLDIGSWFLEKDPFGTIAQGLASKDSLQQMMPQRILTLEELLTRDTLLNIPFNVEIKDHTDKNQSKAVTEIVLRVIQKCRAEHRVLISSFNHDYLVIAKSLMPSISTGALQEGNHPADLIDYLRLLQVAAYHPDDLITDEQLIKTVRASGIGVNVFTVNDAARQKELFSMGATAVFTDFPDVDWH